VTPNQFETHAQAVAARILELEEQKTTPIIAIDGRAASGKTTLAKLIGEAYFAVNQSTLRIVHMDDLYPGWEGLRAGSAYLHSQILLPLRAGKNANWQIWDWSTSQRGSSAEPGNGWRQFGPGVPLVIEGCGSISRLTRDLIDLAIWLEAPVEIRKSRWMQREGAESGHYWGLWQAQEDEFYQAEQSASLADSIWG
jgi:uridine kinase